MSQHSSSTGDWCLPTLQPPPLHINYLAFPNYHKRISCICGSSLQMTLRCGLHPSSCATSGLQYLVHRIVNTNNPHFCVIGPASRSQTRLRRWDFPPTHRGGFPPGWTSPRDFSPTRLQVLTFLVAGRPSPPDWSLGFTRPDYVADLVFNSAFGFCHMSNDTVAPSALFRHCP